MIKYKFTSKNWVEFTKHFGWAIKAVPRELQKGLIKSLSRIERVSQKDYLTGGHPLNVQTGRLRSSVHYYVSQQANIIEGIVGTDVFYGKIHEFGGKFKIRSYTKTHRTYSKPKAVPKVGVRSYTRIVNGKSVSVKAYSRAPAGFGGSNKSVLSSSKVQVQAHIRNVPARPWLFPSVNKEVPKLVTMLNRMGILLENKNAPT